MNESLNHVQDGDESEVILDGLRAFLAHDQVVDSQLHYQVGPVYDGLNADPIRDVAFEQVRAA